MAHALRPCVQGGRIALRALKFGVLLGASAGAALGTVLLPLAGTMFGALYGAVIGFAISAVEAMLLSPLVLSISCNPGVVRCAAALVSAALGAALTVWLTFGPVVVALFATVCGVLAAAVGPRVAYGPKPRA